MEESAAPTLLGLIGGLGKTAKNYFLYQLARPIVVTLRSSWEVDKWVKAGGVGPPPHLLKQLTLREYGLRFSLGTLIETGTYLGDMVNAMKWVFARIYSIEVDAGLYRKAVKRFRRDPRVTILHGDSSTCLPQLLNSVSTPCLFWLDGHYSGGITGRGELETPIISEITAILRHRVPNHVLLIDDAGCFVGNNDYPALDELRVLVSKLRPGYVFEVRDDIIRVHGPENKRL